MNFLSWDNLSRRLSGGVGVGLRFKTPKRFPSPKSSPQGRGLFTVFSSGNTLRCHVEREALHLLSSFPKSLWERLAGSSASMPRNQ